uniref:CSON005557 protein n=1 Tax=Culicoides sonorensis TaxID=179676 RepID=A0A336LV20_CULSO
MKMDVPMLTIDSLVHLFQYLDDFEDLKSVSLVCKQWLQATQIPKILKNFKLCFSFINVGTAIQEPLSLFKESNRVFSNIYFENVKFTSIDQDFWTNWGAETITEVTFDYKFATPDLPGLNFLKLLLYTPQLKTLNLVCSLHLCNIFIKELTAKERKTLFKHFKNVKELQLYFSEVCIDTLNFEPWLDEFENIKNIDFDFYCKKCPIPSKTYEQIFYFLQRYGSKVKGLHICDNARPVHKSVIERLLKIKDMKLKAFDHIINQSTSKLFSDFLATQSDLEYLTVNGSFKLEVFKKMPKLKEIALANGPPLDGFEIFNCIPKLQSLGIAGLEFYDEDDFNNTYKLGQNLNLKELHLIDATVSFEIPFVQRLCECFRNIRLLNLDGAMIDDEGLQYIFQLKKLLELKLSNTQISDKGLIGISSKKHSAKKRKLSEVHETEYSINCLTDLEVLNIDFCKRITPKSYESLSLKRLKHVSGQATMISVAAFKSLSKHCPGIESLNFSKCNSIREKEIESMAKSISGLEILELQNCSNLNEACLKSLMVHCKKLQTLDVSK